jgi:FkbM family methyltransferase
MINGSVCSAESEKVLAFFGQRKGIFIDVGANEPVQGSQTYILEQHGWTGLLIEPNPLCVDQLRALRKNPVIQCACGEADGSVTLHLAGAHSCVIPGRITGQQVLSGSTVVVPVRTLTSLLKEAGFMAIDFLSVDVEGYEDHVLAGLDLTTFRPALVLVEDHVLDLRVHRHLLRNAYRLVDRTGLNNWYVPRDSAHPVSLAKRLKLFRKMYLGTPFRILKQKIHARPPTAAAGSGSRTTAA